MLVCLPCPLEARGQGRAPDPVRCRSGRCVDGRVESPQGMASLGRRLPLPRPGVRGLGMASEGARHADINVRLLGQCAVRSRLTAGGVMSNPVCCALFVFTPINIHSQVLHFKYE